LWLGHFLLQSPTALRRLFVSLERAGLITCRPGPDGGPRLARPAHRIRLAAVRRVVAASSPFGTDPSTRYGNAFGSLLRAPLAEALNRAVAALEGERERTSIADLADAAEAEQRRLRPYAVRAAARPNSLGLLSNLIVTLHDLHTSAFGCSCRAGRRADRLVAEVTRTARRADAGHRSPTLK
jgi:DNA-binding IscR family transcriptional regulator